jgi:hypothetical protein
MDEICADLHIHTRASDGQMGLADTLDAAADAGLEAIAVTDHDRVHPGLDSPISYRDGVEVIRGIEIRVHTADTRVDLLGYGGRRTPALEGLLAAVQRSRIARATRMIDSLEAALGVRLDLTPAVGIGRPQIAAAVIAATDDYTTGRVFDELIGAGCPHYIPRWVPAASDAIDALHEGGALVGLAHPYRYSDFDAAIALVEHLDAIEAYYPYQRQTMEDADPTHLEAIAAEAGLVLTGGSDAHGHELAAAGLGSDGYTRFRDRLTRGRRRTV